MKEVKAKSLVSREMIEHAEFDIDSMIKDELVLSLARELKKELDKGDMIPVSYGPSLDVLEYTTRVYTMTREEYYNYNRLKIELDLYKKYAKDKYQSLVDSDILAREIEILQQFKLAHK